MLLLKIPDEFTVCKLPSVDSVDLTMEYTFLSITDDEISLVCRSEHVPEETLEYESGWRALKFGGVLDLGMIGLLAKISGILTAHGISFFAISTFNTDYVLMKSESFEDALSILGQNGYEIV